MPDVLQKLKAFSDLEWSTAEVVLVAAGFMALGMVIQQWWDDKEGQNDAH